MRGREELVERLSLRRRQKLGDLSDSAYQELVRSVRANPLQFVDDPSDEAFALVVDALDRYGRQAGEDDYLDDDAYYAARGKRMARLVAECDKALAIDPHCIDASLCRALAQTTTLDELLVSLRDLDAAHSDLSGPLEPGETGVGDVWADVASHGRLRTRAAIARVCLDTGRYVMARSVCEELLRISPSDAVGARHSCALALARLEDEAAFDALDAQLDRHGDSWSHLGRVILLFKLGRMSAARRALLGYTRLVEGGAYAFLRPVLVEVYLPDRPEQRPCSFGEATLAAHEADPIVVDTPDLAPWAESQPEVAKSAKAFADLYGYDW